MNEFSQNQQNIRIHLTNITGLGATKLLHSLLPHFENDQKFKTHELHLPHKGPLSRYSSAQPNTKTLIFKRKLPNLISRFKECLFTSSYYNDGTPIIVFGDIPLRIPKGNQVIFLHSSLVITPWVKNKKFSSLKYIISRIIFRINLKYINTIVVQTSIMKEKLLSIFPALNTKVRVIAQPVPEWLRKEHFQRNNQIYTDESKLNFIYPAAYYPHKNHKILKKINLTKEDWPISNITLTIDKSKNPAPSINWINCCGELDHNTLLERYKNADALLFLSLEESYGFPLIEAMHLDLPIISADLPYARVICGENAIYFNPHEINSLRETIFDLKQKLISGWKPDWSDQLKKIPKDWQSVADNIINLIT